MNKKKPVGKKQTAPKIVEPKETRIYAYLTDLVPFEPNPRIHDERNLKDIMTSLKESGQQYPIVVETGNNRILSGNGRYAAAKLLGWDRIWMTWSDLHGAEAEEYALRDNQTGLSSQWDYELLSKSLQLLNKGGRDVSVLGFEPYELTPLLADGSPPPAELQVDYEKAWDGMPAAENTEASFRSILVHCATEPDWKDFCDKLEQAIPDGARFAWHPQRSARKLKDIYFTDTETDEK